VDAEVPSDVPSGATAGAKKPRANWLNLPGEIAASLLAITTVIISLPPANMPPWAIFVSWAGTFAAGGPKGAVLKKLWPVMPIGSTTALLIVLGFNEASRFLSGWAFVVAQMVILGVLNSAQILLGRLVKPLGFVPGMFFGFASYFATYFGGFGPLAHNPFAAWAAVVPMNFLGPVYAWLNVKLMRPHEED
jgi:hypothetical protein